MTLYRIAVDIEERDLAHRVAGALQNLIEPTPDALTIFESGVAAAGTPGWRVEAYFADAPEPAVLRGHLQGLVGEAVPEFRSEAVPDLNWVAISQSALPPVVAGRFSVHGCHDAGRIPQGPNAIRIEAGEAFGTAHHATTFGCLTAIDRLTRRRAFRNILDLGTGSGVLAIALARALPAARIIATDLDARSVEVARENIKANRAARRIRAIQAAGLAAPDLRRAPRFDLIVANILADPLIDLAPTVAAKLATGGALVLSGLLIHQAPAVIASYRAQGLALRQHHRIAGWSTLVFAKRGIAARQARA